MADNTQSEGSKALDQQEHNDTASAKRVIVRTQDLATGDWSNWNPASSIAERFDYSDATTIYTATAAVGSADGDADWTIIKYDLTDSSDASGKVAIGVAWDDHLTETYT